MQCFQLKTSIVIQIKISAKIHVLIIKRSTQNAALLCATRLETKMWFVVWEHF